MCPLAVINDNTQVDRLRIFVTYHQGHVSRFGCLDVQYTSSQLEELPSQLLDGDAERLHAATPQLHLNDNDDARLPTNLQNH